MREGQGGLWLGRGKEGGVGVGGVGGWLLGRRRRGNGGFKLRGRFNCLVASGGGIIWYSTGVDGLYVSSGGVDG